jgi:uncharacterized protein
LQATKLKVSKNKKSRKISPVTIFIVFSCAAIALLFTYFRYSPPQKMDYLSGTKESSQAQDMFEGYSKAKVTIGSTAVDAYVARTPAQMRQGLSGVSFLSENEGMLFVFPVSTQTAFWMKDMLIPLDFIWIAEDRVISLNTYVATPAPDTADSELKLIAPTRAVNYVLEVNAGFVNRYGIRVGDKVLIEIE